jgi:hypothetical protein
MDVFRNRRPHPLCRSPAVGGTNATRDRRRKKMTDYARQISRSVVEYLHDPVPRPRASISADQVRVLFWAICPGLLFIQRVDGSKSPAFFFFALAQLALMVRARSKIKTKFDRFLHFQHD